MYQRIIHLLLRRFDPLGFGVRRLKYNSRDLWPRSASHENDIADRRDFVAFLGLVVAWFAQRDSTMTETVLVKYGGLKTAEALQSEPARASRL